MDKHCSDCRKENPVVSRVVGPHTGLYCSKCGSWIKWASKKEKNLLATSMDEANKQLSEVSDGCLD